MTDDTKTCPVCAAVYPRMPHVSAAHWARQVTCSKECGYAYRKTRPEGDHAVAPSRERSKAAMNRNWSVKRAMAAAKASVPVRVPREAEEAAIASFIAERGVTKLEPAEALGELGSARLVSNLDNKPMAGWR